MLLYHASQTPGIRVLEPRISNHGVPQIYFSRKRENVLVYLSNAVERYCRQTGFAWDGPWQKWGPYGFGQDGRLRLEEYYPDATYETYTGVSAYIYTVEETPDMTPLADIPGAVVSAHPTPVIDCEPVPDALEAIRRAIEEGLITFSPYEPLSKDAWLYRALLEDYRTTTRPDYRHFLKGHFPFLELDFCSQNGHIML